MSLSNKISYQIIKQHHPPSFLHVQLQHALFLLFLLLFPLTLYASAWLQPKDKGLLITNISNYLSCSYWDTQNNLRSSACFRQVSVTPYLEYGLLDKLTVILSPDFNTFSQANARVPFNLENGIIGGRYSLIKSDWSQLSIQMLYNQPFRSSLFGNPLIPNATTALINRQHFIDTRLLYGTGGTFDPLLYNTWYANLEGSFQDNLSGASNQIHLNILLGWKTQSGRLVFEVQELNTVKVGSPTSFIYPNYNLFTIMPDIVYWFQSNLAMQLGISQDFYGKNAGKGTAPFAAIMCKL